MAIFVPTRLFFEAGWFYLLVLLRCENPEVRLTAVAVTRGSWR